MEYTLRIKLFATLSGLVYHEVFAVRADMPLLDSGKRVYRTAFAQPASPESEAAFQDACRFVERFDGDYEGAIAAFEVTELADSQPQASLCREYEKSIQ